MFSFLLISHAQTYTVFVWPLHPLNSEFCCISKLSKTESATTLALLLSKNSTSLEQSNTISIDLSWKTQWWFLTVVMSFYVSSATILEFGLSIAIFLSILKQARLHKPFLLFYCHTLVLPGVGKETFYILVWTKMINDSGYQNCYFTCSDTIRA